MEANLATTNLLLGIMAAVSLLEALVLVGLGIAAFVLYRRATGLVVGFQQRVAPTMARVNAILDDVNEGEGRDRSCRPRHPKHDGPRR
ncbi:MAG: hypothetical protein DMF92_15120 [Acidobacteria bacterium]|nr:MAG: hypothetical protein DMF92_15120 [Acidobacteriota bacterium]